MSVVQLPLLFKHPGPIGLIQSVLFTVAEEYIDVNVQGYIVIHYTGVQRRKFIESHYNKQILSLYARLGYDDAVKLWVACVLYKYGGACICKDAIVKSSDLMIESESIGPVTVAASGSETMKTYILRTFLENLQAPGVRSMSVAPSPVRIYILCHNETRFNDALVKYSEYAWAVPILMKYQDCTFENAFWKQLSEIRDEWISCKFVGTLSYTAFKKINLKTVDHTIREQIRMGRDFFHFMEMAVITSTDSICNTIMKDILKDLRMPMPPDAYCNYWMCSPAKMEGFLTWYETILKPKVLAHPLIMTNSTYKSYLSVAELKALCGLPYYPQVPFVIERLTICFFKQFIDTDIKDDYGSLSKEFNAIYNTTNYDLANPKIEFRYFCYRYLPYMRLFEIPAIESGKAKEAVLIEYRIFPHVEFLVRNAIRFLGANWSYTIVCGTHNHEFMKNMAATIHPAIRVLLTPHANLTPSAYSTLLGSADFWNMLSGDKILIYQEDSVIFREGIDEFLECDYIGAPWPSGQNDAPILVGNGGFSLRTRSVMLDVIAKKRIQDTVPNSSTADYMRNTGSTVIPEDVYFSKTMQELGLGCVATWNMAFRFSTETQYNPQSFAGHNFWLNDADWKKRLYRSLFRVAHIRSPYGLDIGGGEKYLLDIANYFIHTKKCLVIIEVDEKEFISKKTIKRIIGTTDNTILIPYNTAYPLPVSPYYYLLMENSVAPSVAPGGKINIYHCQFPFNKNTHEMETLKAYDYIILNSDFTKKNYETLVCKDDCKKIRIVYPSCLNGGSAPSQKEENTFVLCGRLFEYNHAAHNKNFDKVIKAFNSSTNTSYKLHIIGACYSAKWLAYLKKLSSPNVQFHINCTDEEKQTVLKTAKFMINATGMERDRIHEAFAYEHFGISMIEGLAYGCIPITVNDGFPYYYVSKSKTPLVFDSVDSLTALLNTIAAKTKDYLFDTEYYSKLLLSYNKDNHTLTLNAVLGAKS